MTPIEIIDAAAREAYELHRKYDNRQRADLSYLLNEVPWDQLLPEVQTQWRAIALRVMKTYDMASAKVWPDAEDI
jgi:sulfite reductase beta subunit-like hemoprotein